MQLHFNSEDNQFILFILLTWEFSTSHTAHSCILQHTHSTLLIIELQNTQNLYSLSSDAFSLWAPYPYTLKIWYGFINHILKTYLGIQNLKILSKIRFACQKKFVYQQGKWYGGESLWDFEKLPSQQMQITGMMQMRFNCKKYSECFLIKRKCHINFYNEYVCSSFLFPVWFVITDTL